MPSLLDSCPGDLLLDLRHGDCLQVLQALPDNYVDSIVTDPPYGLSFMGREWDYDVPSAKIWEQCLRVLRPGGHLLAFAGTRTQHRMCVNIEDAGFEIRDMIAWVYGSGFPKAKSCLKPALEPITMARKPAKHVQPLNIDACRVGTSKRVPASPRKGRDSGSMSGHLGADSWDNSGMRADVGRWPANLIHDGSDEVAELFPDETVPTEKHGSVQLYEEINSARFFYCAKAPKSDREDGNVHPTVKPTDLMAYLCRLVTPPGGVVLDPFMGSGSTGKAAMREGFGFVGIEREAEYFEIAQQRVQLPEQQQLNLIP